jgi:Tfp pilus assembly protein PilF
VNKKEFQEIAQHLLMICMMFLTIFTSCSTPFYLTDWGHPSGQAAQRYEIKQKDLDQFAESLRPVRQDPASLYRQAIFLQRQGKHQLALKLLEEAILSDLAYVKAYNAMGVSYDYLGDYPRAIEAYKRALKLNPDLAYVQNNLGYSYLLKGDVDAAIVAFKAAIALDSQNAKYHNNLGLAYAEKGLFDLTLAEFKMAGDDAKAYYNLTQIYARADDPGKAEHHLTAAVNADPADRPTSAGLPKADDLADIADLHPETRHYDHAIADLQRFDAVPAGSEPTAPETAENSSEATVEKFEIAYSSHPVIEERPWSESNLEPLEEQVKPVAGIPELYLAANPQISAELDDQNNDLNRQTSHLDLYQDMHVRIPKGQLLVEMEKTAEINSSRDSAEVEIEVSNGNGVNGMAKRVGAYLRERGFNVTRLTNANSFDHKESKIFYDGSRLHVAFELMDEIPIQSKKENLVEGSKLRNKIRLLIGKDLVSYDEVVGKSKEKLALFPYSIQLASCRTRESADTVLGDHQKYGFVPYIVREDLGGGEVWWRVFAGHYKSREEALGAKKQYGLAGSIIKKTPYSNLISVFSSEIEAKKNFSRLEQLGYSPYIVKADEKTFRLVDGAFPTKQGAMTHQLALQSKGIQNLVVQR